MAERDELVRVIAEALRPALYSPTVSVLDVNICHGQTFDEALAGERAHVERQAAAVVDALGEHLARAWDEGARAAWAASGEGWNGEYPEGSVPWGGTWRDAPNPYRTTESEARDV